MPSPPAKKRTRWAWFFRDRKSKQQSRLRVSPPGLFLLTERPPAVALVLLAFHQRRPHTNTPSMLSTPAHTKCNGGSPDGVCRGNATVQSEPHLLATPSRRISAWSFPASCVGVECYPSDNNTNLPDNLGLNSLSKSGCRACSVISGRGEVLTRKDSHPFADLPIDRRRRIHCSPWVTLLTPREGLSGRAERPEL